MGRDGGDLNTEPKEALAAFLLKLRSQGITDHSLLSAFESVPRRNFVPVIHITEAYARGEMPIECGQSMTAIDRVSRILSALDVNERHRVLELGTGTGYQTALLGRLAKKVVSVERFRTLHEKAEMRISQLGFENVFVKLVDGSSAKAEFGINDRIVSNCAFSKVPKKFLENLTSGGIMIAPIGAGDAMQVMCKFTKIGSRFATEEMFKVRSQPFIPGISSAI